MTLTLSRKGKRINLVVKIMWQKKCRKYKQNKVKVKEERKSKKNKGRIMCLMLGH